MNDRPEHTGRRFANRRESSEGRSPIMLTPLVDMFTIMLIFLLMSYSTGGEMLHMAQNIIMPESLSREQLEPAVEISVGPDRIYVDGEIIATDVAALRQSDALLIPALYEDLKRKAVKYKKMEESVPLFRFTGKATVQADKVIPFRFLKKVLYTADRADFTSISLAVYQKE